MAPSTWSAFSSAGSSKKARSASIDVVASTGKRSSAMVPRIAWLPITRTARSPTIADAALSECARAVLESRDRTAVDFAKCAQDTSALLVWKDAGERRVLTELNRHWRLGRQH